MRNRDQEAVDRIFAVVYLLVGYGFIYTFSSVDFAWNIASFTVFYAAVVLTYLWGKNIHPSQESWFWLAVLLSIGISYAFWSIMYVFQIMALIAVAAYWTLSASGRMLDGKKTSGWVFFDGWNAMAIIPFLNFTCQAHVLLGRQEEAEDGGKGRWGNWMAVLLGVVLSIPALMIVLPLLSSADAGFEHLAGNLVSYMEKHLLSVFLRILFALPVSAYLYGLAFGSMNERNTQRIQTEKLTELGRQMRRVPDEAVCTVLFILCVVYMIFIGLQGKYLFSAFGGVIPQEFTYAEYARRGFFELCQIGAWNLVILWCAGTFARTESRKHRGLSLLTVLLSILTLLLTVTAVSKLGMYIGVYGLTVNRILPMVFLVWTALVFVCVILRQKFVFPVVRICVMAGAVLFCLLCVFPVEDWTEIYNSWARFHGYIM